MNVPLRRNRSASDFEMHSTVGIREKIGAYMTDEILKKIYDATPPDEELEDIADFFKVFGDNTRLKIMIALLQSELCVQDIADSLQMTQSAISHQLKLLKQQDLVKTRRAGKTIFYSLADDHISSILSMGIEHIEE